MNDSQTEMRFAVGHAADGSINLLVAPGIGIDTTLKVLELLLRAYPDRMIAVVTVPAWSVA